MRNCTNYKDLSLLEKQKLKKKKSSSNVDLKIFLT